VPLDRARAELERVAATLPSLQRMDGMTLLAVPLREALLDDDGRAVTGVLAAVGFLLLIVCANVAHLLLAESIARRREFAIRTALGASRGRTVRQLVTEGTLLALLGGVGGLGVAAVAGSLATVLLPANLGQVLEGVPLDARVFGFTLAVSLAAGAVAGIVPAAWVSRRPPRAMLRAGEHGSVPVGTSRVGRVLIVSELALALVLLSGAGVALQDLERRQQRDLGYDADDLLTLNVALTGSTYDQAARRVGFLDAVLARMRALPGVSGAGAVTTFPADGQGTFLSRLEFEGQMPASDAPVIAHHRLVTEGFFEAMGMRLLRGRAIDATDLATSRPVAVVSRSVAERHWPGEDPIGRRLRERRVDGEAPWRTVVGVVGNLAEFYAETDLAWYVPLAQDPEAREARQAVFVVRTPDASAGGVRRLREAVWESDPAMAVFDVATAASLYGRAMAPRRSAGLLTGLFAGVGLLVAALGVYASVAFAVGSRRREIAVRIAVGADQDHVVRGFVREAGGLVLAGLVLGGAGSVVVSRWLVSVTGAPAPSAALVGGSAVVLAAAALVASYLPARRAARTDPAAELRAV
jgi:putative ABC transport system permease protein